MAHNSELISSDIGAYLKNHQYKSLLRFITCGSVDDGKSTLIGRLLFESHMIFEDQLKTLASDSKKMGTQGDKLDFALLVDGLSAEREQGITIDVAYRYFSTEKRKFIVADTPGHEQYTRNMVTAASTASLAIVLVDARKGILTQTKRHSFLASLMGIKNIVLAINKMDLIDYSKEKYEAIVQDYMEFSKKLKINTITPIPISALEGDNITNPSAKMTWYRGPTLMAYLESSPIAKQQNQSSNLRLPVQWVNRPNQDFRGFTGTIASGSIHVGEKIKVMPSGFESTIKNIITKDGTLESAAAGQAITITLNDEIDASRGDVICTPASLPNVADQFEAKVIWMSEEPLHPGRNYWLKCGSKMVNATVTKIKHRIDVNTLEHHAANILELNSISTCNLMTDQNITFDSYEENAALGSFIFIDKLTNNTVGAGLIDFELRRSKNIVPHHFIIDKKSRAEHKSQQPYVLWFTGLSGSGKSTIANLVEQELFALGKHTYILDGDNVRHGLNRDLGFTETDRIENIRRVAEVAKLMLDAGLIVLITFISPFRKDREMARSLFKEGEFHEIFVDCPLEEAEKRDPKGLYKKARAGEIKNFTGIDSPYEKPSNPELHLLTSKQTPAELVTEIMNYVASPALQS
jgi:bifunctional enzyme CysN/CysC